jgi:ribosomal protein S27E
MKGHISQEVINDTFLLDAQQKFPESTLRINCDEHNAPATFYSRAQQKYQCLKCIVAKEDLQYIDKKYKKQLEDFENIKEYAAKAITENAPNIHIIAEWKG